MPKNIMAKFIIKSSIEILFNFFFIISDKVKPKMSTINRLINLKCPITFLKVNLSEKEMCAISFPIKRYSPNDRGNKIYCCNIFRIGISSSPWNPWMHQGTQSHPKCHQMVFSTLNSIRMHSKNNNTKTFAITTVSGPYDDLPKTKESKLISLKKPKTNNYFNTQFSTPETHTKMD